MRIFSIMLLISMSFLLCPIIARTGETDEDLDEDAVINDDTQNLNEENLENPTAAETETDEDVDENLKSSPFVKTNVLFIQPIATDLPAGRLVKVLVGFQNNGSSSFIVDSIDGSFRYPQDFSYYIQNFSVFDFNKIVEGDKEATFQYLFTPSETFSSRQFGLTINLRYKNSEDKQFINTVFNETVNIIEPDEGLDGETFFLYVFLAAIVVLILVLIQQFFSIIKKKTRINKSSYNNTQKPIVNATGTNDVDYQWIPKEHLQTNNKSPKVSPRQRKTNQRNGNSPTLASGNSSNDE